MILERAIGREESKEIVADIATTVRERPTSAAALMSWRQPVQQHDVAISFADGGEDEPSVGRP